MGDMSFLAYILQAPNTDLSLESKESTPKAVLINIFPFGNISNNGSSV
jgi:hypothetical protein